jgi:hypothetical protein
MIEEVLEFQLQRGSLSKELYRRSYLFSWLWMNHFNSDKANIALNNFIENCDASFQFCLWQSVNKEREIDPFIEDNIEVWERFVNFCIWGSGEVEEEIPHKIKREALVVANEMSRDRILCSVQGDQRDKF